MGDDDRLRIGGWVPQSGEAAAPQGQVWLAHDPTLSNWPPSNGYVDGSQVGALSVSNPVVTADDEPAGEPAPWELLRPGRPQGRYRGRRRSGRGAAHAARHTGYKRRIMLVVAAVGTVLVGTGALAKTLPDLPVALPAPPSTPPAATGTPLTDNSRLGTAPTQVPATTPTPAPAPEPSASLPPAPATPEPTAPPATGPPATTTPRAPETLSFEAEAAELSGFVRLFQVEDASRGEVVGMIGLGQTSYVAFTEVTVDDAGEYELALHYVSAPEREAMVSVNDGEPTTIEFPSLGNWNDVGTVTIPVELAAGVNEIWFGNLTAPAPALDRITVTG